MRAARRVIALALIVASCVSRPESEAYPGIDDVPLGANEVPRMEHVHPLDRLALEGIEPPEAALAEIGAGQEDAAGSVFVMRGREGIVAILRSFAAAYGDERRAKEALARLRSDFTRRQLGAAPAEIRPYAIGDGGFRFGRPAAGAAIVAWRVGAVLLVVWVLGEPTVIADLELDPLARLMHSRVA